MKKERNDRAELGYLHAFILPLFPVVLYTLQYPADAGRHDAAFGVAGDTSTGDDVLNAVAGSAAHGHHG